MVTVTVDAESFGTIWDGLYVAEVSVKPVDDVPKYTLRIFASFDPEFIMSIAIWDELDQSTFATERNSPAFPVWDVVKVMTQA